MATVNNSMKTLLDSVGKLFNDDIISFHEWCNIKKIIRKKRENWKAPID